MGLLVVSNVKYEAKHSFLEFIHGGCEINLLIALDFTRSNGPPEERESLHFFDLQKPNDYMQAVKSVGEVL